MNLTVSNVIKEFNRIMYISNELKELLNLINEKQKIYEKSLIYTSK